MRATVPKISISLTESFLASESIGLKMQVIKVDIATITDNGSRLSFFWH